MPFEIIETLDSITPLIQFHTSPVYELVLSIRTLFKPIYYHEDWARHARSSIAPRLLSELSHLYRDFNEGGIYFELPVDYENHDDVPGFFEYVRNLSDADFVFYLMGRIVSREQLAQLIPDAEAIRAVIASAGDHYEWYGRNLAVILRDPGALREQLVNAWEAYWNTFFKNEVLPFESIWHNGLQEKKSILEREGGRVLLEKVTGRADLPTGIPDGNPIESVLLIPVCLLPSRVYRFFGYGNVTVLFDPRYTEERQVAIQQERSEAMATLKALNDETRLEILRLIVKHDKEYALHGKLIAERVDVSASAASRHLALLKDGNLISEEPHKNLITYRFMKDTLTGLVDKLLDYLYS